MDQPLTIHTASAHPTRSKNLTISKTQPTWLWWVGIGLVLGIALAFRLVGLSQFGLNTDEVVYSGQAASMIADPASVALFPIFRAHPLLFHSALAVVFQLFGISDFVARLTAIGFGLATLLVVYRLGAEIYDNKVGLLAAMFLALMPYHLVVSRQVLLDGPLTLLTTLTLLMLVRFSNTQRARWLYATGIALGLAFLAKETGIVFIGAIFVFFALRPKVKLMDCAFALICMGAVMAIHPIALVFGEGTKNGQSYLIWQLLRESNHALSFYLTESLPSFGYALVAVALLSLVWMWRHSSWRELLLALWVIVPVAFFTIWPVKGYHYLLSVAPALALLAARWVISARPNKAWFKAVRAVVLLAVLGGLGFASWQVAQSSDATDVRAGTGGMPAGREIGTWIGTNAKPNDQVLTIGSSLANAIRFYGHRTVWALSVSLDPLKRNPAYEPIRDADAMIQSEQIGYIAWDMYSASRSPYYARKIAALLKRYNGRLVHEEVGQVRNEQGQLQTRTLMAVYEVHPNKLVASYTQPEPKPLPGAANLPGIWVPYGIAIVIMLMMLGASLIPINTHHLRAQPEAA